MDKERCDHCKGKGYTDNGYTDEYGRRRETRLDCSACAPCFKCEKRVAKGTESLGMNMPGVTPGPIVFCHQCQPIGTAEDITEQIERFLNAPRERGRDGGLR